MWNTKKKQLFDCSLQMHLYQNWSSKFAVSKMPNLHPVCHFDFKFSGHFFLKLKVCQSFRSSSKKAEFEVTSRFQKIGFGIPWWRGRSIWRNFNLKGELNQPVQNIAISKQILHYFVTACLQYPSDNNCDLSTKYESIQYMSSIFLHACNISSFQIQIKWFQDKKSFGFILSPKTFSSTLTLRK